MKDRQVSWDCPLVQPHWPWEQKNLERGLDMEGDHGSGAL